MDYAWNASLLFAQQLSETFQELSPQPAANSMTAEGTLLHFMLLSIPRITAGVLDPVKVLSNPGCRC